MARLPLRPEFAMRHNSRLCTNILNPFTKKQMHLHLQKKLYGYANWLQWRWNDIRFKLRTRRERAVFEKWLNEFKNTKSQVILGANFNKSGGVKNHLAAIKKYSKSNILLAPPDELLNKHGTTPFTTNTDRFLATPAPSNCKVVHTHVLPWLINWAKTNRSRKVRWLHTHHLFYYPSPDLPTLEPWQSELNEVGAEALKLCDLPISVSRWQRQYILDTFGIDCLYLPNGVDVRKCDSAQKEKFLSKHRIGLPFILWVGNRDQVKNPFDFVKASALVKDLQFIMIGGPSSAELATKGFPCPSNLTILPSLPHSDIINALAACKMLAVTSHREGLPTLVLEAMALAKPVVIPDEPGCMNATYGETHATVYESNNVESLARAIESTLNQTQRPDSRSRVLEEFDWRIVSQKLDLLYQGAHPKNISK